MKKIKVLAKSKLTSIESILLKAVQDFILMKKIIIY